MSEPYEVLVTVVDLEGNKGATGPTGIQGVPGQVTSAALTAALALKANLASPTFTGTPAAPTAATSTSTTQVATTAYVRANRAELEAVDATKAPLANPTFTETPAAPTAATATNTTQIATTAYVRANRAELEAVDALKAPIQSPELTGTPIVPTPTTADNTTKIATTAHVRANRTELESAIALDTNLNNPSFTGNVVVPEATDPGAMVNKFQMETAIAEADAAVYPYISPNPPETNLFGRLWMKTPENHTAVNIGGDNFAPLWPPTDNRAVNAKAAVALLEEAVGWWDAAYANPGERYLENRGSVGEALNAEYGTTSGNTIIQDGKAVLPGVAGSYLSVPDHAALDITGDIDIRVMVALDDWTPAADLTLAAKYSITSNQRSWRLGVDSDTGKLKVQFSATGSSILPVATGALSSVAPVAVDGEPLGIRATIDVDNGSSGHTITFYTSPDFVTWTQLGTPVITAGVQSIFNSTAPLEIGTITLGTGLPAAGKFYRVQVLNGINGTVVVDVDCSVAEDHANAFYARTGQLVTVNPSGIDSRDPDLLTHDGRNYVALFANTGDTITTPADGSGFLSNTEIYVEVEFETFSLTGTRNLFSHYAGNDGQRRFIFSVNANGGLNVSTWTNAEVSQGASSITGIILPYQKYVAAFRFNLLTNTMTFYLNGQVVANSTMTITQFRSSNTVSVRVGHSTSGQNNPFQGKIYDAQMWCDGRKVVDFDASDLTSANQSTLIGRCNETWTFGRASTGKKLSLVVRPILLFADDVFIVPDNPALQFNATDSFTLFACFRDWTSTPQTNAGLMNHSLSPNPRWMLINSSTNQYKRVLINDGVNSALSDAPARTLGALFSTFGVVDRTSQTITAYMNNAIGTPSSCADVGSLEYADTLSIMRNNTAYTDGEFVAAAVFRRVLTTEEIALINNFYGTV